MFDITFIKDFINEIIAAENINREDLDSSGAIYYCNGRNGTKFDFQVNEHSSGFLCFWKNEKGAIKVYVQRDNIVGYCYFDKNDAFNSDKIHEYTHPNPTNLRSLCNCLYFNFDLNDVYDAQITDWDLASPDWQYM